MKGDEAVLVRMERLELSRSCPHQILSLARLPIPPHPHGKFQPIKPLFFLFMGIAIQEQNKQPMTCCPDSVMQSQLSKMFFHTLNILDLLIGRCLLGIVWGCVNDTGTVGFWTPQAKTVMPLS